MDGIEGEEDRREAALCLPQRRLLWLWQVCLQRQRVTRSTRVGETVGVGAGVVSEVAEAVGEAGPLRGVVLAMHKLHNLLFVPFPRSERQRDLFYLTFMDIFFNKLLLAKE